MDNLITFDYEKLVKKCEIGSVVLPYGTVKQLVLTLTDGSEIACRDDNKKTLNLISIIESAGRITRRELRQVEGTLKTREKAVFLALCFFYDDNGRPCEKRFFIHGNERSTIGFVWRNIINQKSNDVA